jgi:hypothetical protein
VVIVRGNYTGIVEETVAVTKGGGTDLGIKSLSTAEIGNGGITWKGSLAAAPAGPRANWAYYNTADKKSYIYDGTAWQALAQDGAPGEKGGAFMLINSTGQWEEALARISAGSGGTSLNPAVYILHIPGSVPVKGATTASITGDNKTVRLTGAGTLSLSSAGSIFYMDDSSSQILFIDGPTLKGMADNTYPVVYAGGGTVELGNGAISGNTARGGFGSSGGGVSVASGTFTMSGGAIRGNTSYGISSSGGGVFAGGGTFTMEGGEVCGNATSGSGGGVSAGGGGTFIMSGGTISGNTANGFFSLGGGVSAVGGGTFAMNGGAISGNTAAIGGGVYTGGSGGFTKTGGTIYGDDDYDTANTAASTENPGTNGHAVFYMTGADPGYTCYYRNETLGDDENGNISAADELPAESGETLNNWTMR